MHDIFLILHNIRSVYNVGAIFRTADGVGVKKVYLCGYTPSPIDRFGRKRTDIAKASLGAEDSVEWEHVDDVKELITLLKKKEIQVLAVEQHDTSVPYDAVQVTVPTALVLGPEVEGIEEDILDHCDAVVEIPMHGAKESLNVSVAAGIVLYALCPGR